MADAITSPSESFAFFPWLRRIVKDEIAAYPGRSPVVARMVIAATITMIIIMTFRIPGGFEGALYAFLVARDDLRATFKSGLAIAVSYTAGVTFVLICAGIFASHPSARFLWFASSMFVVFFALHAVKNFAAATTFGILMVLALPIWQTQGTASNRVELTLWQGFVCVLGTVITVAVETVFRSLSPTNEFFRGIDDRLSVVQQLVEEYRAGQPISQDVAKPLEKYTITGVSGLRRTLARSHYERLYRDQLSAVIALTGRLIDLGASSAKTPHELRDGDGERLGRLALAIANIRISLIKGQVPDPHIVPAIAPSGIPLLPEMERTAKLIPQVFSRSESLEAYFPSMLDQEENVSGFFKEDAFRNPEHVYFALRGCLAATMCYFLYEILGWRGISTSVTTCVLTALSNIGMSRQKQFLRISGAIAGGLILGIGSQILILPRIDTIAEFSLLFASVTAIAAWFATSSQRLSYFGVQIANAYYLITVQGFSNQTSLQTARDRVVGIILGLFFMWLAYQTFSTESAAEHMLRSFVANLRAIADLTRQPKSADREESMRQIRRLRSEIRGNFDIVSAQYDTVPLEFGASWKTGMEHRALVQSWDPQLQSVYLLEVALLQHRVFGADEHLSSAVRMAQLQFNEACAELMTQMADHVDGKPADHSAHVDAQLAVITRSVEENSSDDAGSMAAHGLERLSRYVRDQLTQLSKEIGQSPLVRTVA